MTPAARAAPPTLVVPRVRFELACGARLVVSRRPEAPVTALRVHVRGARQAEPDGREGLAALAGALLNQGTRGHSDREIADLLEPAGGALSGSAGGLAGSIAGDAWPLLMELASEMLMAPAYPAPLVRVHKQRLLSRLEVERDEPRVQAERSFRGLVYGQHWMGRPARGTVQSVSPLTSAQLRAFHKRVWVPNQCTIGVCGDVDPARVRRELDRLLAGWSAGAPRNTESTRFPRPAARVDAFTRARQQVHLYLGHLGIRRNDPDYAALTVMDHVLGTGPGFTNRITRRLRDELGLAYAVHADIHSSAGVQPGAFMAYIGTAPENVPTALEGFLREIRAIQARPVSRAELETARSYLLGSFALGFERASRRAGYLIQAEVHGFPDDYLELLPRQFAAVSASDVQRAANRHLLPDACCVAAGGPVSKKDLSAALALTSPGRGSRRSS